MINTPIKNVLIPMVGSGSRFRNAGYKTYKPFILINGKPMIQHVLDAFPKNMKKYILYNPAWLKSSELEFLKNMPDIVLCSQEGHKHGPAFSILRAAHQIPLDQSFFVSYCDIFWTWEYERDVLPFLDNDGIVFTRRSFHPHLVKDNFSAFCRPQENDVNLLSEIQEKKSFTNEWMSEPLSIGVFYFKSGQDMITAIHQLIEKEQRVANEFFPSLAFNELVRSNKKVKLIDVDFFIHWGVPAQLNDFLYWTKICKKLRTPQVNKNDSPMSNICCMGGLGSRMKSLGSLPKALLPINGEPMFKFVSKNLIPQGTVTILTVNNLIEKLEVPNNNFKIINLGDQTSSQYQTLLRAKKSLIKEKNFILSSCDALGFINFTELKNLTTTQNSDAVIFTFDPTLLQNKLAGHHTFVSIDGNRVTQVHIKSKSTLNDVGLAGLFWFKDGEIFGSIEQVPYDSSNEMSADHFLKHLVEQGKIISALPLDAYIHLGTPEEFKEFEFWQEYTAQLTNDESKI